MHRAALEIRIYYYFIIDDNVSLGFVATSRFYCIIRDKSGENSAVVQLLPRLEQTPCAVSQQYPTVLC